MNKDNYHEQGNIIIMLLLLPLGHISNTDNVAKRNGPSDGTCVVCESLEDANHAMFQCALARFAWSAVRQVFQQNWNPRSGTELLTILHAQSSAKARIVWTCVGALLWSLWTVRNKMTMEHKFPANPTDVIFKCHLFLQSWAPLGKQCDADLMRSTMEQIATSIPRLRQVN